MDTECEEALIDLWSENACLYDVNSAAFSNKIQKRKILEDMGSKLNLNAGKRLCCSL